MKASSSVATDEHGKHRHGGPLFGVTIVVTRPAGDARAALAAARARGATAIALPGMALRAFDAGAALRARLDAALGADIWIFTSPAAVRFMFRACPAAKPSAAALVIAPGDGTRRALARRGLTAVAPDERFDSEGVLALPQLAHVTGRRVVLIGAPGGRDLIGPTLRARGATVESIDVYVRSAPRLRTAQVAAFVAASAPIVTLLSSAAALTHLLEALPADACMRWRSQTLVVSSARLATIATVHRFEDVHIAASASISDLLDAAHNAITRHRL